MVKAFLRKLLSLILYPFKFIIKTLIGLLKRLKFSIAFKISTTYLILYIIIIMTVALATSAGYLIFELQKFEATRAAKDAEEIISTFPDFNKINTEEESFSSFEIFDKNLNTFYTSGGSGRYADNLIVIAEKIVFSNEYIHSESFLKNGVPYYMNVSYPMEDMLRDVWRISLMVLISGAIGLMFFAPIVSSTSYKLIGPIKKMTEITKTITVNNINTRLDVKGTEDELKELSETFNEMMDRIEGGYKIQQQFVSDASHELRTPIAVIKGYVDMLDRWGKNDKAVLEESIAAIKNETDNMQDLIEKLLFIARSDRSTLNFTKEDFRIKTVLNEIEKETKMIDTSHKLYFKFYDDATIYGDKMRIKQAVRILLDNAMKYTPPGEYIMVSGYIQDEYYVIKVEDTGVGINKNDLDKIFDRLYRAEESRSRQISGHGLGLSIAKIIVLGHKGKIKVKSSPKKGSAFSLMFPYLDS
ncbi:MAG: HAMP domain-containing sensor histidine kinase [Bacillota bacterium]|jgi:signal transduction histidine kinase|nr:HAMP domain-containing sensor histidine kinase [Bacillota bacterium]NLL59446.1 HAMP domain-containing histidine kinase [Tissierellia bacterium]